jgi:hypothetical protein
MNRYAAVLLLLGAAGVADAATTIYRCGPGGREFSQRPCAEGTVVPGTDGRTAAQRAAAARIVEEERRKAAALERERRAREAQEAKAAATQATGIDGLARPAAAAASDAEAGKPVRKSARAKDKQPKDFVVVQPVVKK